MTAGVPRILLAGLLGLAAWLGLSGDDGARARDAGQAAAAWTALPKAPITGRIGEGVVWTGTEMVVWGGTDRRRLLSDGAAYSPATGTWRTLAAAPAGVRGVVGTAAVWTGGTALFWAGNSPDGPARGAVYDPRADSWQRIEVGPLGPREGYTTLWTGTEALILSGTQGDGFAKPTAAAVDPKTGKWRRLPALDRLRGLLVQGVWSGREAYLAGTRSLCPSRGSSCRRSRPIFLAYDPATDHVRRISLAKAPDGRLVPVAWTGSRVLFTRDDPRPIVLYDPKNGRWSIGRSLPCGKTNRGYRQSAWIRNRFLAPCGAKGLRLYSPPTDTWQKLAPGRSPLNSRADSAVVWTGKELIAWGGMLFKAGNPMSTEGALLELGG